MTDMTDKLTYEEYLERNGSLTYSNVGTSMLPLLRMGRDLFVLEKKGAERCKKYDVVLYRARNGSYVLHRVVRVLPDGYVMMGDNNTFREYGVTDDDVIAVMTRIVRDGVEHSVTEPRYRIYSVLRVGTAPLRVFIFKVKSRLRRVFRG